MEYKFVYPLLPSYRRMTDLHHAWPGMSLTRQLQNEKLQSLSLQGRCLDFGGGEKSRYAALLPDGIELFSLNINAEMNPTHITKPGEEFPFEENYFDCVISLNVLEHVYDPNFVIREMHRVMKPDGVLHIMVPFMFRIHGSPDDYSRHTPSWWKQTMQDSRFASAEIEALTWGRYSAAASFFAGSWHRLALIRDTIRARKKCENSERYSGREGDRICAYALGWCITATK